MKKLLTLSIAMVMIFGDLSCHGQSNRNDTKGSAKVEAYYFHFTSRCVTCRTVEAEARKNIETLYGNKVSFHAINLDEESSKTIADKLKVGGQTLLIVKGDTRIDITTEGFMYARNNPEKFKAVIKEKIDPLL